MSNKERNKNRIIKPKTLKGFRDFLPDEERARQLVLDTFRKTAESFGFEPLSTPSLEYASTLLGKYGADADRLVYTFKDRGGREVGLIYDLTVPTARVLATYQNEIKLPFKRYQIQRVWRAEKPQKGRYREFVQADFDIFGPPEAGSVADAEVITLTYNLLTSLTRNTTIIKVNSRPLLFSALEQVGITNKNKQLNVLRVIDKLDKKSEQKVTQELEELGFINSLGDSLLGLLKSINPDEKLSRTFEYLGVMGINEDRIKFDPTLVRGLDYYTGMIFEATIEGYQGSVAGGGRYDNLIEQFGGPPTPAVGGSIGVDRIVEILKEQPAYELNSYSKVLVTIFDGSLASESLKITQKLRQQNINTEVYPDPASDLRDQLDYANRKNIPFVVIIGPEEMGKGLVTIKNMRTGGQEKVDRKTAVGKLKAQSSKGKATTQRLKL